MQPLGDRDGRRTAGGTSWTDGEGVRRTLGGAPGIRLPVQRKPLGTLPEPASSFQRTGMARAIGVALLARRQGPRTETQSCWLPGAQVLPGRGQPVCACGEVTPCPAGHPSPCCRGPPRGSHPELFHCLRSRWGRYQQESEPGREKDLLWVDLCPRPNNAHTEVLLSGTSEGDVFGNGIITI